MDIIGEMYKVKFNPKDYCKAPTDTYGSVPALTNQIDGQAPPQNFGPLLDSIIKQEAPANYETVPDLRSIDPSQLAVNNYGTNTNEMNNGKLLVDILDANNNINNPSLVP